MASSMLDSIQFGQPNTMSSQGRFAKYGQYLIDRPMGDALPDTVKVKSGRHAGVTIPLLT